MKMKKVTIVFVLTCLLIGFGMIPFNSRAGLVNGAGMKIPVTDNPLNIKGFPANHPADCYHQPESGRTKNVRTSPGPGRFSPLLLPALLPVNESFNTGAWPADWTEQFAGDLFTSNWQINNSSLAGGTPYEAFAVDMADEGAVEADQDRLVSPPFNTTGMTSLNVSFRQRFLVIQPTIYGSRFSPVPMALTGPMNGRLTAVQTLQPR